MGHPNLYPRINLKRKGKLGCFAKLCCFWYCHQKLVFGALTKEDKEQQLPTCGHPTATIQEYSVPRWQCDHSHRTFFKVTGQWICLVPIKNSSVVCMSSSGLPTRSSDKSTQNVTLLYFVMYSTSILVHLFPAF